MSLNTAVEGYDSDFRNKSCLTGSCGIFVLFKMLLLFMNAVGGMECGWGRKLLFNPCFLRAESRGRDHYNRYAMCWNDRKYFPLERDVLPMAAL